MLLTMGGLPLELAGLNISFGFHNFNFARLSKTERHGIVQAFTECAQALQRQTGSVAHGSLTINFSETDSLQTARLTTNWPHQQATTDQMPVDIHYSTDNLVPKEMRYDDPPAPAELWDAQAYGGEQELSSSPSADAQSAQASGLQPPSPLIEFAFSDERPAKYPRHDKHLRNLFSVD